MNHTMRTILPPLATTLSCIIVTTIIVMFACGCRATGPSSDASSAGSQHADIQAAPDGMLHIDAMSYNIRYGTAGDGPDHWQQRRMHCIELIDQHGGDFVGLQEALRFQVDEILASIPRYDEVGVGRDDGAERGEHCTILYDTSRWSLDREQYGTFWLSETPDQIASTSWGNTITRIVTWARFIERSSGRAIWVYNTHFDHRSQPSRERSSLLLAARIAARAHPQEPVIITGDFNAGEENPAVRYLTGEIAMDEQYTAVPLIDTFRAAHPDEPIVGTFNGFRFGSIDGPKIDYIFVQPHAQVYRAAILRDTILHENGDRRYPSDHFPVIATIRWPQ